MAALELPLRLDQKGREKWWRKNTWKRNMNDSVNVLFICLQSKYIIIQKLVTFNQNVGSIYVLVIIDVKHLNYLSWCFFFSNLNIVTHIWLNILFINLLTVKIIIAEYFITVWMKSSSVFLVHPGVMRNVKCLSQIQRTTVCDATRSKHRKLNLIIQVSWESVDVPKRLKFTSNKNPRTQATCCYSNKTTATHCRSYGYSSEALLTSQCNISTDLDKASPTHHQ